MLLELPVTVRAYAGVSTSATVTTRFNTPSSLITCAGTLEIVGPALIGDTVTVNVCVAILFTLCPSFTLTVTTALPLAFAAGVNVSVPVLFGLL